MSSYFYDPDCGEALEHVRSELERLRSALEDIASGDWQRYPNRERHGQTTVAGYARWLLEQTT